MRRALIVLGTRLWLDTFVHESRSNNYEARSTKQQLEGRKYRQPGKPVMSVVLLLKADRCDKESVRLTGMGKGKGCRQVHVQDRKQRTM